MKIKSILNNSALIAINEKNEEIVLIGRGISFQKHPNDEVDASKIEKEFSSDTKKTSELVELLQQIPEKYFEITNAVVRYANKKLSRELDKSVYVVLFDHINSAIERHQEGINLDFAMLSEIGTLYPNEYEVAQWALEYINVTLDIALPEDECGFIAIHIISASTETKDSYKTKKLMKIVRDISNLTMDYYHDAIDINSMNYSRYLTHLKYLALRYLNKEQVEDSLSNVFTLNDNVLKQTEECVNMINDLMKTKYEHELSEYEKKYIILHLCRLMNIN